MLLRANYIFSKDLDDGSEIFTTFSQDTSYSANLLPGGRGQDYGPSAYDHRQYFSVAYVYSPKGLRSDNKFTDAALGVLTRHWTIAGVSQLQSELTPQSAQPVLIQTETTTTQTTVRW